MYMKNDLSKCFLNEFSCVVGAERRTSASPRSHRIFMQIPTVLRAAALRLALEADREFKIFNVSKKERSWACHQFNSRRFARRSRDYSQ